MLHHQLRIIIDHIWCDDATILIVLINHIIIITLWLFNIAMENGPLKYMVYLLKMVDLSMAM